MSLNGCQLSMLCSVQLHHRIPLAKMVRYDVFTFMCTDFALVNWSYPNLLRLTPRPLSLTPVHANAGSR